MKSAILRSITYLHCCNPPSQSVAGLQQLEIFEPILCEMTGSGETGDTAPDDDELVVVLQLGGLRVLLRHDDLYHKSQRRLMYYC